MSQQINLYQPMFRRERKIFASKTVAQMLGALLLGLGLIWVYGYWQVTRLESQLDDLAAQELDGTERLETLSRTVAGLDGSAEAREAERTRERLMALRRVMDVLTGPDAGTTEGFGQRLTALGRQRVDRLWLTRTRLGGDGEVRLEGLATDPELVAALLKRLRNEPVFAGTRIRSLAVDRPEESNLVEFTVSTEAVGPGAGGT